MRVFMMNDDKLIAVAMSCVRCVCVRRSPMETRMYNDQLMRLERAFLDPQGLPPSRPFDK